MVTRVPSHKANRDSGLLYDGSYPTELLDNSDAMNSPQVSNDRFWLSQPQRMNNPLVEVLAVRFRQPVSVNRLSFQLLQINQNYEIWYMTPKHDLAPLTNLDHSPVRGTVAQGDPDAWVKINETVSPVTTQKIELRISRRPVSGNPMWVLGVRNFLASRMINSRAEAAKPYDITTDSLGNIVTRTVKDWDSRKALDDNPNTFWKSQPQPSPDAVVSMYLNITDDNDQGQVFDSLYIDPVYTGQNLNLYYSDDDTVAEDYILSGVIADVSESTNVVWNNDGLGAILNQSTSKWSFSTEDMALAKNIDRYWMGLTWAPQFDSPNPGFTNYLPIFTAGNRKFAYNPVGAKFVVLDENDNPVGTFTGTSAIRFYNGTSLNVSLIIDNESNKTTVRVFDNTKSIIYEASYNGVIFDLVNSKTLSVGNAEGAVQTLVISQRQNQTLQDINAHILEWVDDPTEFFELDKDTMGGVIFGGNLGEQEIPFGGVGDGFWRDKTWSPIWKDYVCSKGYLTLPSPVSAKYLKLEFTNLAAQSYPIWESGIKVQYKSFPLSVERTLKEEYTTTTNSYSKTVDGRQTDSSYRADTWQSGYNYNVVVNEQPTIISNAIPGQAENPVRESFEREVTRDDVWRSTNVSHQVITQEAYYTVVAGDYLIAIGQKLGMDWWTIYKMNSPAPIDTDYRVGLLPKRSAGWWIFPGQRLKISKQVMQTIVETEVNTRKTVLETTRSRFATTSVHRYETKEVTRDAAVAYFAGIKDIAVFSPSYQQIEDQNYQIRDYHIGFSEIRGENSYPVETKDDNGAKVVAVKGESRRNLVSSTPGALGASRSSFVDDDGVSWWVFTPSISVSYIGGMRSSVPLDRLEQGQPYIAGAYLHNPSTTARSFRVNWCDQGYKVVTVGAGETIALLTDPTIADYSNAFRFVDIRPSSGLETNREPFWLRQITVVKAPWDNPYPFNGDTPDTDGKRYVWTGTPDESESIEYSSGESVNVADNPFVMESDVWPSMSPFNLIRFNGMDTSGRLYVFKNTADLFLLEEDEATKAMWDDTVREWGSNVAVWGYPYSFDSSISTGISNQEYKGYPVLSFPREATEEYTNAVINSRTFEIDKNPHVKITLEAYRESDNDLTLQIVEKSSDKILVSEKIDFPVGQWSKISTELYPVEAEAGEAEVRLLVGGKKKDNLLISSIEVKTTFVAYYASNDGGENFYDITRVAQSGGNFVFPMYDTRLKIRVVVNDPTAILYGFDCYPNHIS